MITLTHSEGFAYDLLSIACVKFDNNRLDNIAQQNVIELSDQIRSQVELSKHYDVIHSLEYTRLYDINREMYIRINEIKQRTVTAEDATYIDDRVYQRFLAKKALQEKWFPEQPLTEQKFGYQNTK